MSVYRDKNNKNKWYAEVPTGGVTSSGRPSKTRRTAKTKAEATRIERELKTQRDNGLPLPKADLTVAAYLTHWLNDIENLDLADATKISYNQITRDYLVPHLGRHKLKDLHQRHIDKMIATISKNRSSNTCRIIKRTLSTALTAAMRNDLVIRNVATLSTPISVPKRRELRIQPEQITVFQEAISGHLHEDMFHLLLHTGVRRGEACAIKWSDIHFDDNPPWISIERSYSKTRNGYEITNPKTTSSVRSVALSTDLAERLRQRKFRIMKERFIKDMNQMDDMFVFESILGGPPRPDTVTHQLTKCLAKAGLEGVGPHQLRHLITTIVLSNPQNLAAMSTHLGHSNIRTTADIYGHQSRDMIKDISTQIEDSLRKFLD